MFKAVFKSYVLPVATLAGSIIGVGIFSLPYVALKSGIWLMLGYFLVLTLIMVVIHSVFAEISLKTPDFKRFPGFVGHHLGKTAKAIALFAIIFGAFGVLLAYLIVGSGFLANIFQPYFGGGHLVYALIYFLVSCSVIWFGIKAVAKVEFIALALFFISLLIIFIKGFFQIKIGNIFLPAAEIKQGNFFLPYGVILFALWGTGLIPEVEEMLGHGKKNIKKIIIIATLIPAGVYILFTFLVLGIAGNQTTESALLGIKNFLGRGAGNIAIFAGVITTFTAFIAQGLTLKKVLIYDLNVKKRHAFMIACFTPFVLFLLGMKSFIPIISFTGGVLLGVTGILILLMYAKIGGKKAIFYPLSLVFLLGLIYEIIYFIK